MTGVCFAYIMRYKELNIEKEKGNGSSANKGRQPNSLSINQPKPYSLDFEELMLDRVAILAAYTRSYEEVDFEQFEG